MRGSAATRLKVAPGSITLIGPPSVHIFLPALPEVKSVFGISDAVPEIGVFCQNFLGAVFAQIYSLLADGTPLPMGIIVVTGSVLSFAAGVIPFFLKQRRGHLRPER